MQTDIQTRFSIADLLCHCDQVTSVTVKRQEQYVTSKDDRLPDSREN